MFFKVQILKIIVFFFRSPWSDKLPSDDKFSMLIS